MIEADNLIKIKKLFSLQTKYKNYKILNIFTIHLLKIKESIYF